MSMFLGRNAAGSGCKYRWKFAGTTGVGGKLPPRFAAQTRRGPLGGPGSTGGREGGLEESCTLFPGGGVVNRGGCGCSWGILPQTRRFSMFPPEPVSATAAPGLSTSRFSGLEPSLQTRWTASLSVPGYRTPSRASSTGQKPANTEEQQPAAGGAEVKPTDIPQGEKEEPEPDKKRNKTAQLKKVFKEYGAVGVSFHIGISLISLGLFYLAVSSGINMAAILCKLGFSESVVQSKLAAGTSTFVLAYAVHKLFAPLRISITLVSVPLIVRHLRRTGLFKPPPPSL